MTLIDRLRRWLMGKTDETIVQNVPVIPQEKVVDKVKEFNFQAPWLFSRQLSQFGYFVYSFYAVPDSGFLTLSKHSYFNEQLKLNISIEQAPYYTDYGFSIFLTNAETRESILLCNVPHERQDPDLKFMSKICDEFFKSNEVLTLIKGEEWRNINPLGLGE